MALLLQQRIQQQPPPSPPLLLLNLLVGRVGRQVRHEGGSSCRLHQVENVRGAARTRSAGAVYVGLEAAGRVEPAPRCIGISVL